MTPNTSFADDPATQVQVTNFKSHQNDFLRGFIDVRITPAIVVKNFKLFEKDGQRWVNPPAEKYKKRDGTTGYTPMVEFTDRKAEHAFRDAVLLDLDRYLRENGDAG